MASNEFSTEFNEVHYLQLPNNETYAFRKAGNKEKVLILLHGNIGSSAYFSFLVPYLMDDFSVIAPDLRGYGHSTYNKPIITHADLADDLKLFMNALNIHKCSIAALAVSVGPAFLFSVKYPERLNKLIFFVGIGPKGSLPPDITDIPKSKEELMKNSQFCTIAQLAIKSQNKEIFRQIYAKLMNDVDEDYLDILSEESLLQRSFEDMTWANANFNVSNEPNALNVPGNSLASTFEKQVLIFAGEKDTFCKPEVQKEWKELLGDHATLKFMPDYGHGPRMDQAELTSDIFYDFLATENDTLCKQLIQSCFC
jgi:pimeloyl-ACP methyl ester carboxylesterase